MMNTAAQSIPVMTMLASEDPVKSKVPMDVSRDLGTEVSSGI